MRLTLPSQDPLAADPLWRGTFWFLVVLLVLIIGYTTHIFGQAGPPPKPALLCFTMQGCAQCQQMKAVWDRLESRGQTLIYVSFENAPELFRSWNVAQTPTTIYAVPRQSGQFKGRLDERFRFVGVKSQAEVESLIGAAR